MWKNIFNIIFGERRRTMWEVSCSFENVRIQCACACWMAPAHSIAGEMQVERNIQMKNKFNSRPAGETSEPREFSISSRLIKVFARTEKKRFFRVTERRDILAWMRDGKDMRRHKISNVYIAARCLWGVRVSVPWCTAHDQNAIIACAETCQAPGFIFESIVLFNAWPSTPQCHDELHLSMHADSK